MFGSVLNARLHHNIRKDRIKILKLAELENILSK